MLQHDGGSPWRKVGDRWTGCSTNHTNASRQDSPTVAPYCKNLRTLNPWPAQHLTELLYLFIGCILTLCECQSGATVVGHRGVKWGDTKGLWRSAISRRPPWRWQRMLGCAQSLPQSLLTFPLWCRIITVWNCVHAAFRFILEEGCTAL